MRLVHGTGAAAGVAVALVAAAVAAADARAASSWSDVVDAPRSLASPATVIVVLDALGAASRPLPVGGPGANQAASRAADRILARLARGGFHVGVERRFTRLLVAVEATVPAGERWALARAPGVRGVYPVRALVPTSIAAEAVAAVGPASAPIRANLAGDGSGIEIAVLDGPVDDTSPSLAGRVDRPSPLPFVLDPVSFSHGTAVASIAAGAPGPSGLGGVAEGARILAVPILHPTLDGGLAGTTADLLAGLETAADPNGDGDLGDRARVVLAAVNAPFAGFDDAPEAQAIAAISTIGTVVVAAAGNDGPAGASRGTIGSPGAAPDALTVGATDGRSVLPGIAVMTSGLGYPLAFDASLGGLVSPPVGVDIPLRGIVGYARPTPDAGAVAADYLGADGLSAVRGAAVLVPRDGGSLRRKAVAAAAAGVAALLVYGDDPVPAGSLGADDALPVPIVSVPAGVALEATRRLAVGDPLTVRFGDVTLAASPMQETIAPFSSTGLTEGGAVKPDVVLPGVAVTTALPTAGWAAATGTSVAAAQAAGLLAVLAAAHPGWSSASLRSALSSTARLVAVAGEAVAPVGAQGGGAPDVGAASAAALDLLPGSLTFGRASASASTTAWLQVTNRNATEEVVTLAIERDGASAATVLELAVDPSRFILGPHATARLPVTVAVSGPVPDGGVVGGWIVANVPDGPGQHVPFAIVYGERRPGSIVAVTAAAQGVDIRVGELSTPPSGGVDLRSVATLTVDVVRGSRVVAHAFAARDLLPGRIRLRLRPVDRLGHRLPPGRYRLVLTATDRDGRVEVVEQALPWR